MIYQVTTLNPDGTQSTVKTRNPKYKTYEGEMQKGNILSFVVSKTIRIK